MKIILNQDVPNLGEEGDVCVVKDGYARNYLLPTGAAVVYNNTSLAIFKSRAAAIEKRKIEKRKASAELKGLLDNVTVSLVVATGESGKLFGSVTSAMIQEKLKEQGFDIEKKRIEFASHSAKMAGLYTAKIHLYENESSVIKVDIKSEAELKKAQKEAEEAERAAKAEAAKLEAETAIAAEAAVEAVEKVAEAAEEVSSEV